MRYFEYGSGYGIIGQGLSIWIIAILAWTLYWKGRALWRAARLGHFEWFIAILVINTLGLLEIAYLYYFTKPEEDKKENKNE
ncbi:MAG: hypothetical protein UT05_C0008G0051 [Parcubacteria group bacterium GW2011_GWF2_38_76]|nr:MAG: hypothetical protein UT05_C0008G0051 [Parcubacteria group bacterium GW2011_GWF2_38_76]HBM45694.1 hypothetical protein [Patescibacteria group bacterium]